jgi:VCBS repeat-containing protein
MNQWWKKSNRRKPLNKVAGRSRFSRTFLNATLLDDRIVPATFSMTNSTPILIPADQVNGVGSASPDPSTIAVSGLTGVVTHLTVTLNDLSHEEANDVQVLLRAPDGTNIYLMANNGGVTAIGSPDATPPAGPNVTFDSSATDTIGAGGVGAGPYAPLNASTTGNVTSNLPAGTPAPVTTMGLGGFYGINPNGAWGLYIDDVNAFDVGQMTGGWTLSFNYQPNSPPVANPDTFTTPENTTLTVNTAGVLTNDTDADGNPLTAHLVTAPANGTVTLNGDGTFTYVPNHYFSGADTFTYKDDDGITFGNTTTVTVNVTHVNQPPQAFDNTYTLQNGGPQYVGPAQGVLANAVDPDGSIANSVVYAENFKDVPLQAFPTGVAAGAHNNTNTDWSPTLPNGWVLNNAPTGDTPTPVAPPLPNGGNVYDGWHVLNIDSWIAEQGDQDRSKFLNENQYPGFAYPNVGSNTPVLVADGDAYDDYVSLGTSHMNTYAYLPPIQLNGGVDGTLKLDFDQSFRPENPADGLQQATVDVSFDGGATWTNLLTQDNTHGPNAPYAAGDESRINQHVSLAVNNPAGATAEFRLGYLDAGNDWWWAVANIKVTDNQTDPSTLTAHEVTGPSHGTFSLSADGAFTYTANAGYTGPDSFSYTVTDGQVTTAAATANITVVANAAAPVAVNDAYSTNQGIPLNIGGGAGLLINDSDPDTGGFVGLTTSEVTPPSHGTLTFNADGSFIYTPTASFSGTDSFTYQDSDSVHASNIATVTFTVAATNLHPPVAGNDTYSLANNGTLTTTAATGVLANDTDADGNSLTAIRETPTAHGTLTLNADGSFNYVPHQFFYGTDSFTYEAFDGLFASNVATVTITVNHVDVAPAANPDAYATAAGTPLTTTAATGVLANDRDDGVITTLMTENFDELPLSPFPIGIHGGNGGITGNPNGDWTDSQPAGWTLNNAPAGLSPTPPPTSSTDPGEVYYGWHVLDIDSWIHEQGDQDRSKFLNESQFPGYSQAAPNLVGSHNHVLVADGDAYQDYVSITPTNPMNTMYISPSVSLAGLNQNSLTLEFDSSFRPEEAQEAKVDVTYDGGTTWTNLLDYTTANSGGSGALTHINEHLTLDANNPAGATAAQFRFSYLGAGNDWWWTIDNVKVTGETPNPGSTLIAAVASQPHNGTVAVNPNGSFIYTPNAGFTGLDSFTYTASDGTHVSAPATATVLVGGGSLGVQVNDGSAQRSQVRSITVGFNGAATFAGDPAAAFQLTPTAGGANVPLTATVTTAGGMTDVTLTFSGTGTDAGSNSTGGPLSLADGAYQLTVLSAQVSINGAALDGDNDGTPGGNYVSPTEVANGAGLHLYRLFGDVNGDGFVNGFDLVGFRPAIGSAAGDSNYVAALDADNNGFINGFDLIQFRNRIGNSVFN